jgi:hypothetical protein
MGHGPALSGASHAIDRSYTAFDRLWTGLRERARHSSNPTSQEAAK